MTLLVSSCRGGCCCLLLGLPLSNPVSFASLYIDFSLVSFVSSSTVILTHLPSSFFPFVSFLDAFIDWVVFWYLVEGLVVVVLVFCDGVGCCMCFLLEVFCGGFGGGEDTSFSSPLNRNLDHLISCCCCSLFGIL